MAGINYSRPLLGAGASAQTDFAAAQARTGLNFQGDARFKRGFKAELGLEAFADASAELSKFVRASIEGTAFARAKAGIQLQLPLNLFDEFGFSVRAEAIAEAAAGIEADLGLSIGEFVLLAQRDQDLIGLPLELLLLFLEEVSIGGAFEVNVSASAKAHASISVTGCVIENAGKKAGFFYTVDAGVGLAAGVGMGFKAGATFKDFRRFYGRATDKAVDATLTEIAKLLPDSANDVLPVMMAFGPVAKIALRFAYDIGKKIKDNNPGGSRQDMNTLCNEAVKTILEECQRFILPKMVDSALDSLRKTLEQQVPAVGQVTWEGAMRERAALAGQLLAMPAEPFQPVEANVDYWKSLITAVIDLTSRLYGTANVDPAVAEAVSILYCASELMLEAVRSKVNKASAYVLAIGAGTVAADTRPFQGALAIQPIRLIKNTINSRLGASANRNLTYADLLQFLVDDLIVTRLLAAFPDASQFISIFKTDLGKAENEVLKIFLTNASSFVPTGTVERQMDPHETLRLIVGSLDRFIADKFRAEALPKILESINDPNTKLYVEEVLYGAVVYIKDVALKSVLNWERKTFDNDDFTEALAAVMALLLGRTVVIVADTFLTATMENIGKSCDEIAVKIRNNHKDVRVLNLSADPDLIRLAADCVRIGGQVLGPLDTETRSRIRHLLYQVFEPIPPGGEQGLLENLGDQFFIPNADQLGDLTNKLAAISKDRFALFVEKFVLVIGNYILDQLEELILEILELIANWEKNLAASIRSLAAFLEDLEGQMARLNGEIIDLFGEADAALRQLLTLLSGRSLRTGMKSALKDAFVDKAIGLLEDNPIYKNLPREYRTGRRNLNAAIDDLINVVVDPVLDAVTAITRNLEEFLQDCRELDPEENLPEQVMLLLLDRIEDNIRRHFGGRKPHLDVAVRFSVKDLFGNTHSVQIPLARIELNLNPFLNVVRETINDLDFYHDQLNNACFKLADAFAKELERAAAELSGREKPEERLRLEKIAAEHDIKPREVAILNPTVLSHHSKAIDFSIHLGGVPLSFLGLGRDESQRVLIYLNGTLIPVKSLLVEESTRIKNMKVHKADFDFLNAKGFDVETGILRNNVASIVTDTAKQFPAQLSNIRKRSAGFSTVFHVSERGDRSVIGPTSSTRDDATKPILAVTSKTDSRGRKVSEYKILNNIPGRGNPGSRTNSFLNDRIPGLLVQFRVELGDLINGVNVLTVVVVEKGGDRHQQNVSFTVAKAKPKSGRPLSRLAGDIGVTALEPRAASSRSKGTPKKPVVVALSEKPKKKNGRIVKKLNTLLPVGARSLVKKKQEALKYLRAQDKLNLSVIS